MKKIIDENLNKFCDRMILDARLKNGIKYCLGLGIDNCGVKRLRPLLFFATASDTNHGKKSQRLIKFACSIEMLHCASLILDDLQDNCETRRGLTSAWKKFGVAESLMICHAMVALSFRLMDKKFLKDFSEVYFQMCLGQTLDITYDEKMTTKVYEKIVINKTGALFAFAMKVSAQINKSDNQIVNLLLELGYLFGFIYQINDDLKDKDLKITERDMRQEIIIAKDKALQLLEKYTSNFSPEVVLLLPQIFKDNLLL